MQCYFLFYSPHSIRYLKATWPKNYAYFDLNNTFTSRNLDRDRLGSIKIYVPLKEKHYYDIQYELTERSGTTTGFCTVDYNQKTVLNGQYLCKSESRGGFNRDDIDISIENEIKPIGIKYVHQVEHTGSDTDRYVSAMQ